MISLNDKSVEMPIAIRPFLHDVEVSPDEQSIERALKLALRRLPENERLSFFAHAITSPLPVLPRKTGLKYKKHGFQARFLDILRSPVLE